MNQKVIQSDSRQKRQHHKIKEAYFVSQGYRIVNSKMLVGDYAFPSNGSIAVDTKADMQEVVGNICGKEHARFRRELELARACGISLTVLIENKDGITCIKDVFRWVNPRLLIMKNTNEIIGIYKNGNPRYKKVQRYPGATKGATIAKAMLTMEAKYDVRFEFCSPGEAGAKVLNILRGGKDEMC